MKEEKEKISLPFLIIGIIAIWIIATVIIWFVFKDWGDSGTFGDTFGAINSLFSGLALAGIIYTIYLQKTELSLQRKELEYTRLELKRTADAQESSSKLMTEQLRINNIPILNFLSFNYQGTSYIEMSNNSDSPIFNMDIYVFIVTSNEEEDLNNFIDLNVQDSLKETARKINEMDLLDGDTWAICDRGFYNHMPKQSKLEIPIYYPLEKDYFFIFVQYMDILGNNYYMDLAFNKSKSNRIYLLEMVDPIIPTMIDRIDFQDKDSRSKMKENEKLFEAIKLYETSVFALWLKGHESDYPDFRWGEIRNR